MTVFGLLNRIKHRTAERAKFQSYAKSYPFFRIFGMIKLRTLDFLFRIKQNTYEQFFYSILLRGLLKLQFVQILCMDHSNNCMKTMRLAISHYGNYMTRILSYMGKNDQICSKIYEVSIIYSFDSIYD